MAEIGLGHLEAGMGEPVREFAVVGEQHQALGVVVQPADVEQALGPVAEEVGDGFVAAGVGHGGQHLGRLVEGQVHQPGPGRDPFPVHPDHLVFGVDPGAEPADRLPVDLDPARADEFLAVPAAPDPRLGQDLLQPDPAGNVGQAVPFIPPQSSLEVRVGRSHSRCPRCLPAGTARGPAGPPGWPGPVAPGSTPWSGTDGTGLGVSAGFLDQAAQHQRAHHAVAVDPADGRDAGPADRLPVGDHGQGLQRGLGEADLLPVADEPLDQRGAVLAGVVPPAAGDLAQVEAAALDCGFLGQVVQFRADLVPGPFEYLGEDDHRHRLVGDQQDRLQAGSQAGAFRGLCLFLGFRAHFLFQSLSVSSSTLSAVSRWPVHVT